MFFVHTANAHFGLYRCYIIRLGVPNLFDISFFCAFCCLLVAYYWLQQIGFVTCIYILLIRDIWLSVFLLAFRVYHPPSGSWSSHPSGNRSILYPYKYFVVACHFVPASTSHCITMDTCLFQVFRLVCHVWRQLFLYSANYL